MIVFDASALVSAAIRRSVPSAAFSHALRSDLMAVSRATMTELRDTLARPRLARFLDPVLRDEVLALLDAFGIPFAPAERVTECRDPKDDMYLELALASGASVIVSGDADLLVLNPWRSVRILRPAAYLANVGAAP